MRIERFNSANRLVWDKWIRDCRAPFYFLRSYIDYHGSRFIDHSMMFYDEDEMVGLIPAIQEGSTIHSHKGLSYGGWIGHNIHNEILIDSIKEHCENQGIESIIYRPQPTFYGVNSENLHDSMEVFSEKLTFIIPLSQPLNINTNRKRNLKKSDHLEVKHMVDVDSFYSMLYNEMMERHKTSPIHTKEDLVYLCRSFPDNIKIFAARHKENVGYIMTFLFRDVIKCQYIVSDEMGYKHEAITQIVIFLAEHFKHSHMYLDLGAATDEHGNFKESLARFKRSLGAEEKVVSTYQLYI